MAEVWILVGGELHGTVELRRRRAERPDLVIAADGGIRHAGLLGVRPDLWVGDFDSSDLHDPRFADIPREPVPRAKDFTDAELALRVATERGATHVTFWGAFGGRVDHTLALALLAVRTGPHVELHGGDQSALPLVAGQDTIFPTFPGQVLSVVALDDLAGLSLAGVRWPLRDADVPVGSGWTLSNEATGVAVRAEVQSGRALLVRHWP